MKKIVLTVDVKKIIILITIISSTLLSSCEILQDENNIEKSQTEASLAATIRAANS